MSFTISRLVFFVCVCIAIIVATGKEVAGGTEISVPGDACALVTRQEVSALIGSPVSGGDNAHIDQGTHTSVCVYRGASTSTMISVDLQPYESAAAAKKDFDAWFKLSAHQFPSAKRDVNVGDDAFWAREGPGLIEYFALQRDRVLGITLFGPRSATVPIERMRGLMESALKR